MKSYHAAKLKLDISKEELMSMKASEVLLVKIWYTGICIFFFKRKESELLFRNRFSSG